MKKSSESLLYSFDDFWPTDFYSSSRSNVNSLNYAIWCTLEYSTNSATNKKLTVHLKVAHLKESNSARKCCTSEGSQQCTKVLQIWRKPALHQSVAHLKKANSAPKCCTSDGGSSVWIWQYIWVLHSSSCNAYVLIVDRLWLIRRTAMMNKLCLIILTQLPLYRCQVYCWWRIYTPMVLLFELSKFCRRTLREKLLLRETFKV